MIQSLIHLHPPPRSKPPHRPNNHTTRRSNNPHPRKQPPIPNSTYERLRHHSSNTRKDIPDEIIRRNAMAGFLRHEFRQHGRRHRKYEHGADTIEEIGEQWHEPEYSFLRRPTVPDEGGGVQECCDPGVLSHAVFGDVD